MLKRVPLLLVLLALLVCVHRAGGLLQGIAMPVGVALYVIAWAIVAAVALSPALALLAVLLLWRWYRTGRPPAFLQRPYRSARRRIRRLWRRRPTRHRAN
jgi:hypothetical protein